MTSRSRWVEGVRRDKWRGRTRRQRRCWKGQRAFFFGEREEKKLNSQTRGNGGALTHWTGVCLIFVFHSLFSSISGKFPRLITAFENDAIPFLLLRWHNAAVPSVSAPARIIIRQGRTVFYFSGELQFMRYRKCGPTSAGRRQALWFQQMCG